MTCGPEDCTELAIDVFVKMGTEDEMPYVSLPLKLAFYAKVRYRDLGKLACVPYPFETQTGDSQ